MKRIGLFPGSFDPFTKGHEAVVLKSLELFDEVIIGIGVNESKKYLFSLEKRIAHIQASFSSSHAIKVQSFQKLTVDFCAEIGASHIIRGLRDAKDFGYERPIAHLNYELKGIETVFFLTDQKYSSISSTIIREIYKNDGDISSFVTKSELLV